MSGPYLKNLIQWDSFQRFPIGLGLMNATYNDHIWWAWFYVTFLLVPFYKFLIVTYWILLNKLYIQGAYLTDLIWWLKYFIPAIYLMDLISCDFSPKAHFRYLEGKYWIYWIVFNKCCIQGPYLMYPISCDFFGRSVLNI